MWGSGGYGYGGYGGAPIDHKAALNRQLGGKNWNHPHGAPFGMSMKLPFFFHHPSIFRTDRKRLNAVAILLNVVVPWVLFCVAFALFSFNYQNPWTCWSLLLFFFVITMGPLMCCSMVMEARRQREPDEEFDPMWYKFLVVMSVIGLLTGTVLGLHNFETRLSTVYQYDNLATYRDVDPANYVGQQLVDAGHILFNDNTHLDIAKSMGFKDTEMYCVAPIVSSKTSEKTFVDFWAVGKGCCSGISADFHCKDYNDANAHGGLRLMDEASRPFYRLAVQQAEATYKIRTHKPLFFEWNAAPIKYTDDLKRSAAYMFTSGAIAGFFVQLFIVAATTLFFAKSFPLR